MLDRKLYRDLWQLKGQVITIALVVACGIAAYVAMQTTWGSLQRSRGTYYERYRFGDVFASLERAPESLLQDVEAIPGVALAYGRLVKGIMLPVEFLDEPATGTLVSLPGDRAAPLNAVYLRSGRMPLPGRADEVLLGEAFAKAHDLRPGVRLPAVINGKLRNLAVVGVALSPEFIFNLRPGDLTSDDRRMAVMWMDRAVMAPAFRMEGAFNDLTLRLQPGASEAEVLRRLDELLAPYGGFGAVGRDKQLSNFVIEGELSQLESFATVVPFIFLAVAAFLLNIVLSRMINLQRQQIAVFKALGYSDRTIALHYLKLAAVVVVLGAVLGVILGSYLGQAFTNLYGRFFRFPILEYRLEIGVVVVAVGISLIAAVAGALIAVLNVLRLPPAEAMRPPAPASYRRTMLERLGWGWVFGQSSLMVVRELRRRPLRLLASSVGIAAAVGIMVVGRFGYDSFSYLIDNVMHRERRGQLSVVFVEPVPKDALADIEQLPGVQYVEGSRMVPVRFRVGHRWRDAAITAVPATPNLRRIIQRDLTEARLPTTGLAISAKLGEILGLGVGDEVTVEILEGQRTVHRVPVAALVDDAFGLQGYMTSPSLHAMLGQEERFSGAEVRIDPAQQSEILRRLKEISGVLTVNRIAAMAERFREQGGENMMWMTLLLSFFGAVIAIGVVYNNARISLSMRSRDLASLRVLGFTRAEISSVLLAELAVQMVLAIPLGLLFGTWWANAIMATVDPETYRLPIVISQQSYAFALAVTIAAGAASALLVRRKLDHLDLIGVLKTRE